MLVTEVSEKHRYKLMIFQPHLHLMRMCDIHFMHSLIVNPFERQILLVLPHGIC